METEFMVFVVPFFTFVTAVLYIGLRSLAESEMDPILLSLTFFGGSGTITTALLEFNAYTAGLGFIALLTVVFQLIVFQKKRAITTQHIHSTLQSRLISSNNFNLLDFWVKLSKDLIPIDFYPEMYENSPVHRENRRSSFLALLPPTIFDTSGLNTSDLLVPARTRKRWWWAYVIIALLCWILLILSSIVSKY